jgi:hypothetical protein
LRTFVVAVLFTGAFASFSVANAAGGCGPGWHRGPYGACVVNGPVVVAPGGPVVVERPVVVAPGAPVVVERPAPRACPYGFAWAYGRCRPI